MESLVYDIVAVGVAMGSPMGYAFLAAVGLAVVEAAAVAVLVGVWLFGGK